MEKVGISEKGLLNLLKVFKGKAGYAQNKVRKMQQSGIDPRDYDIFMQHLRNRGHYRILSERLERLIKIKKTKINDRSEIIFKKLTSWNKK